MDFWGTLKDVGINTADKVSSPVFSSIGVAFQNVVTGTANKLSSGAGTFVSNLDPTKKAPIPTQNPTASPNAPSTIIQAVGATVSSPASRLLIAAALVVLLVYLIRRRTA